MPARTLNDFFAVFFVANARPIETGHGMLQQIRDIKGENMNRKIYVANLPYQATEPELKTLFSKAGSVISVKIVQDRQSGQPRGIAFVEMSTQWEGRRAVSMLNRQDFMGKNLLVKEATEKRGFQGR
jgi:RNA recognition motif-containing protein